MNAWFIETRIVNDKSQIFFYYNVPTFSLSFNDKGGSIVILASNWDDTATNTVRQHLLTIKNIFQLLTLSLPTKNCWGYSTSVGLHYPTWPLMCQMFKITIISVMKEGYAHKVMYRNKSDNPYVLIFITGLLYKTSLLI